MASTTHNYCSRHDPFRHMFLYYRKLRAARKASHFYPYSTPESGRMHRNFARQLWAISGHLQVTLLGAPRFGSNDVHEPRPLRGRALSGIRGTDHNPQGQAAQSSFRPDPLFSASRIKYLTRRYSAAPGSTSNWRKFFKCVCGAGAPSAGKALRLRTRGQSKRTIESHHRTKRGGKNGCTCSR